MTLDEYRRHDALGLADLVLYLVFRYGFDRCYGIGCFL